MIAMRSGGLLRFEEITRCVPDVQDALVSILSDKAIAVPELPDANMVWARPGFNVIATANTRDQGVNELSAALKRRFNYIHIPIVADAKTEVAIVQQRSAELLQRYRLPLEPPPKVVELITTVFREIREGRSAEGVSVKQPSTTLSTAEAIGVAVESTLRAAFFGQKKVGGGDIARNIVGSVVKEDLGDLAVLKEYATLVAKKRGGRGSEWDAFYQGLQEVLPGK
jgi:MoxR-like ATPase